MEKQQTKLLEAARVGSIASLQQLLKDDPLILDRAAVNCFNETPLHVAAMLGHVDFMREIVELKPELVNEFNSDGSSPLHLASAKDHADAVEALLRVDTRACMHRDRNQMLPLHLAATKGRIEAMLQLLQARPEAAATCRGGESILHLCVKRYQLEALRVMVKSSVCSSEFLNSKDGEGNTVLHLAVAEKQVETVSLLVSVGGIDANAVNDEGMTVMDVLIRSRRDVRDAEIEKTLFKIVGTTLQEKQSGSRAAAAVLSSNNINNNNLKKQHDRWLDQKKNALMVVASWTAITAIAWCYALAIDAVTPSKTYQTFGDVVTCTVYVWIGLMALLLIAHTIRMIVRLVKKIRKAWMRMRARRHASLTRQNP